MKRMTDEEFSLRFDSVDLGGWAKALLNEALRARAREARLEAALRNLIPVAVSHGVSEQHGAIANGVAALEAE